LIATHTNASTSILNSITSFPVSEEEAVVLWTDCPTISRTRIALNSGPWSEYIEYDIFPRKTRRRYENILWSVGENMIERVSNAALMPAQE
jgi:hypothetical protein